MDKLIGYICVNFLRPDATKECILSLEKNCPYIRIYIADQDEPNEEIIKFYNEHNVKYFFVPEDCGISYCRNLLIEKIKEPYLMWGDNDFIFTENNNHLNAIKLLELNKKIGFVGGSIYVNGIMKHYERELFYDKKKQLLIYIPLDLTEPIEYNFEESKYYYTDLTFNYVITPTKIIQSNKKLRWNESLKVTFEHTDFFLKLKLFSKYKLVYFPDMSVIHHHIGNKKYFEYRHRKVCGENFADYWNLKMAIGADGRKLIFKTLKTTSIPKSENSILLEPPDKSTEKNEIILPKINKQKNSKEIIKYFIDMGIDFWLLKNSCYEAVIKNNLDTDTLTLGVPNNNLKDKILELNQEIKMNILVEPYRKTKILNINNLSIKVPFPLIKYLEHYMNKSWNIIKNE